MSGFSTGIATGLIEGINDQYAQTRQMQAQQQDDQLKAFQDAAKEYDAEQRDVKQRSNKMAANAALIAGGEPDENALSLAYRFDQSTEGKKDLEGDLLKQYQNDYKYMNDNPDKITRNQGNNQQQSQQSVIPANIDPAVLARFGVTPDRLNAIYGATPNVQAPNNVNPMAKPLEQQQTDAIVNRLQQEMPIHAQQAGMEASARALAGASPEALAAIQKKAQATAMGQMGASGYTINAQGEMVPAGQGGSPTAPGLPTPQTPQMQPQQGMQQPQGGSVPQVPASQLQPPPGMGGGQPPQGQAPQGPTATPQQPTQGGQNSGVTNDNQNLVGYLSDIIKNGKEAIPATAYNDNFLKPDGPWDQRNYAALGRLTRDDAITVKAMSNGDGTFTPYMMARGNAVQQHMLKVLRDFDHTANEEREKNKYAFAQGPQEAQQLNRLSTALGHMGLLNEAAKAVSQGNIPLLNKIANVYGVQTGNDAQTTFNTLSHAVANELRAVYGGRNSGLAELEATAKNLDIDQSPQQRAGVLRTMANMLTSKIAAYDQQQQQIMGLAYNPNHTFLAPHAVQVYQELTRAPLVPKDPSTIPSFSDPNADEFKKLGKGEQFTIPGKVGKDGKPIIFVKP